MKTTLVITISANGKILASDKNSAPLPQEVNSFIFEKMQSAGNVILGRTTYQLFAEVFSSFLSKWDVVVLSDKDENIDGVTVVRSTKEAIRLLKQKNHKEAIVLGGISVYNSFINEGLFDTIHLTMLPVIAGNGSSIATDENLSIPIGNMSWEKVTDNILRVTLSKS